MFSIKQIRGGQSRILFIQNYERKMDFEPITDHSLKRLRIEERKDAEEFSQEQVKIRKRRTCGVKRGEKTCTMIQVIVSLTKRG